MKRPCFYYRNRIKSPDMITVDTAAGGARNEGGVTHAPEASGLGVEPYEEVLGAPVMAFG